MSSNPTRTDQDYASQLLDLESQLSETMSDASLRQDVFIAIRKLLQENSDGERDVRRLIMERFNTGQMRKETLMVVQKMLERVVADAAESLPDAGDTVVMAPKTDIADAMAGEAANEPVDDPTTAISSLQIAEQTGEFEQPLPGTVLRERYLLQTQVSGGSMGVVFKSLDRRLAEVESAEPWVAVKVLTPELSRSADALRAMQQEAAKGRCLSHANIVRFIDLDREGDTYFIVMEWIEGRSLAQILDDPNVNKLSDAQILAIAQQLGEALEYAHQCGVVHADVKPANVMMKTDGQVKLIDFGIARVRQQHRLKPGEFDPKVLGAATPAYSSMQVLTGEAPAPADDVFSLACLIYRMIAGYRVYGPRNAREAAEEGMSPQQPHGLDDEPWKVLKKALSFARVSRYTSPREFVTDLAAAFRDARQSTLVAPNLDIEPAENGKSKLPWLAAAMLVLGLGTFAVWESGILNPPRAADSQPVARSQATDQPATTDAPTNAISEAADAASEATPSAAANAVLPDEGAVDSDVGAEDLDIAELLGTPGTDEAAPDVSNETAAANAATETPPQPGSVAGRADAGPNLAADVSASVEDLPEVADSELAPELVDGNAEEITGPTVMAEAVSRPSADVTAAAVAEPAESVELDLPEPLIGEATHRLFLTTASTTGGSRIDVLLRENGAAAIIDLIRSDSSQALELVVEELNFSGNRTELTTRQYALSNDGWVRFAADQEVSQLRISMTPDPAREADLRAELIVRNADTGEALGELDVVLEDDDQRAFEARIAPNTVGFAVSQVSVSEDQTAAQIDVVRYRPDSSPLEIGFMVQDVTASEGDDFFAPAEEMIRFGPNQRAARILVPLVQDAEVEGDEAFFIELIVPSARQDAEIFRRIAVMIRDDDS